MPEEKPSDDLASSVRELVGAGAGVGADLFAAHRHDSPCDPTRPLQQQIPFAPQQLPR